MFVHMQVGQGAHPTQIIFIVQPLRPALFKLGWPSGPVTKREALNPAPDILQLTKQIYIYRI